MKKKEENEQTTIWYRFFVKYFLIGLVLILVFVIYDVEIKKLLICYPFWQRLLSVFFSVIGILGPSLVVASVFTYSIESKNFIEYIKDKIEKTMIKKEFLDKLNDVDKREALRRILAPSDEKYQLFSNIKNYFEETITKSMTLFDYTFKSHFTIDVNAMIKDNKVCLEETICQRIYKGKNGFEPIKFGFGDFVVDPEFVSVHYTPQNGKNIQLKEEDMKITRDEEESGSKWIMYSYEIPKSIEGEFISVNIRYIEFGSDHWQLFAYKTMIPSEGIKVTVNCIDDLVIKEYVIFDNDKNYICHISDNKKKIEISTSQWISSGNGVNVLVARK
jgi:hypothetical protein